VPALALAFWAITGGGAAAPDRSQQW